MPQPSLDIVLPCYNPQEGWWQTVADAYSKICNALTETKITFIIVNDGSAKNLHAGFGFLKEKIPLLKIESYEANRGKGYAVRKGVSAAEGDVVIYTDIDFPYEESDVVKIYEAVSSSRCDVALGTRDESYYRGVPVLRKFISRLLKKIIRLSLRVPTPDTQAGLKGFNKKGKEIFLETTVNRYLFDLEFIRLAARKENVRIALIPVSVKKGLHFSSISWWGLFGEGINFLRIFFR